MKLRSRNILTLLQDKTCDYEDRIALGMKNSFFCDLIISLNILYYVYFNACHLCLRDSCNCVGR